MAKVKKSFFCQSCGAESPKWVGKCPSCGAWNSYVEEVVHKSTSNSSIQDQSKRRKQKPVRIMDIESESIPRLTLKDQELNRVLGGGIVPGSLVLIGGEPGIGKSTLMLQLALSLPGKKVVYLSGEESTVQIKMRADRLKQVNEDCYIVAETLLDTIFQHLEELEPDLLIIDSIQTLHSPRIESGPGSVSQVRECTGELLKYAKENQVPVFLVGHITKDGSLAGPKVLEHMVDTVLQFEGDRHLTYRILRTTKNRFGSTSELGIYEMQGSGLREVSNPSEILISQRDIATSGVAIASTLEGNRPLVVEIQALVSPATYGTPQRSCTGFDTRRLNMLLAVLEKRTGQRLGMNDVFLNVAGGLKIEDPAVDLAVCMAVVSSLHDEPLPQKMCFAGEVGLGVEIRAVHRLENRMTEAGKLGFEQMVISKYAADKLNFNNSLKIIAVRNLRELMDSIF